jgi:Domain of unknown function (DUF5615)
MRLLIDECAPFKLKSKLAAYGHVCQTVQEAGFGGMINGDLLTVAEGVWDVLVTVDKSMRYQQNLTSRNIAILVIRAKSSDIDELLPYVEDCVAALKTIKPGQIVKVGDPSLL